MSNFIQLSEKSKLLDSPFFLEFLQFYYNIIFILRALPGMRGYGRDDNWAGGRNSAYNK